MADVVVHELQPRWLSWGQAERYCSLDERTLRRLAAEGSIRVSSPRGGRSVIDRVSLDALLEARVLPAKVTA